MSTSTPVQRSCPCCASTSSKRLAAYSPETWNVVECLSCGFVYLENPPPYEALESDFAWEKTHAEKKAKGGSTPLSAFNRWLRRRVSPILRKDANYWFPRWFAPGPVLDVGSGNRVRVRPPHIPYGIELSRVLHARGDALMRALGGKCLHAAGAVGIKQFDADFFTGIIMHSYLEHEVAVNEVLRGAYRALQPGGKVFVRVPNFASLNRRIIGPKWCGFRYPDHVNYFTPDTLRRVAANAGFDTRLMNRATLWVDDNIQALLIKPSAK